MRARSIHPPNPGGTLDRTLHELPTPDKPLARDKPLASHSCSSPPGSMTDSAASWPVSNRVEGLWLGFCWQQTTTMISNQYDFGETLAGKSRSLSRALIVLIILIAGGCQSETPQPDYLARSQDDCTNGDQSACAMLGVLSRNALHTQPSNAPDRQKTQRMLTPFLMASTGQDHCSPHTGCGLRLLMRLTSCKSGSIEAI
jgi:hypothetical protein